MIPPRNVVSAADIFYAFDPVPEFLWLGVATNSDIQSNTVVATFTYFVTSIVSGSVTAISYCI